MKGALDLTRALKENPNEFIHTEQGSYFGTSPFVRFLIFLSGPVTNFLLSTLLFALLAVIPYEKISDPATVLNASFYPTLYHTQYGQEMIENGDLILSLDGKDIRDYQDLVERLGMNTGTPITAQIQRDGKILPITLTPIKDEKGYHFGLALYQKPVIGRIEGNTHLQVEDIILSVNGTQIENTNDFYVLAAEGCAIEVQRNGEVETILLNGVNNSYPFAWKSNLRLVRNHSLLGGIKEGFLKTGEIFTDTITSLFLVLSGRSEDAREIITGPTRAASSIGNITLLGFETSKGSGLRALLYLLSVVSISIGVANILPIPNFDGGQMLVNLIEIFTHRNLTPKGYVRIQIAGLAMTALILISMYALDARHYLSQLFS